MAHDGEQVAYAVGFNHESSFSRSFAKQDGTLPSALC